MAAKSYSLDYDGYWRVPNISGLPANSGIYCVYTCVHNVSAKTVTLSRLLYIGEAGNVRNRIANHERWDDWVRELKAGEELCFNAALISPAADRERAEAAMIHHHKPPCNVEYPRNLRQLLDMAIELLRLARLALRDAARERLARTDVVGVALDQPRRIGDGGIARLARFGRPVPREGPRLRRAGLMARRQRLRQAHAGGGDTAGRSAGVRHHRPVAGHGPRSPASA